MHSPEGARQGAPDACVWPDASHGAAQNETSSETFSTASSAASKGASALAEEDSSAQAQAIAGDLQAAPSKAGTDAGSHAGSHAENGHGQAERQTESQTRDQAYGQTGRRPDGQASQRSAASEAPPHNAGDSLQERRMKSLRPEIARRGSLTRKEYQELAGGVSMRTAQYDLQTLVRQGLLETQGRGPALRYVYTGKPEASED